MNFFLGLEKFGDAPALIADNATISYQELAHQADVFAAGIRSRLPVGLTRPLVLIEATNDLLPIIAYAGAVRAGWPVILGSEGAGESNSRIVSKYRPNVIVSPNQTCLNAEIFSTEPIDMHPDLAVLLSTSGTTGATKLVRLSKTNLEANAAAISSYLALRQNDRALTVLPFHYSYGMSVLHIHLLAGAALVLTNGSLIDASVRGLAQRSEVTSLAMVPTQFELVDNLSWLPKLRYITQAGGRIDPIMARRFAKQAETGGWKLFIMYGQTEAGPRMSYLPPQDAKDWHHTIGRPIPGGAFHLLNDQGQIISDTGTSGELVYEGPNVMMGYALDRSDLAAPVGPSILHTGDIAEHLENGYYRITGRASRFIKPFGLRIALDEVETRLREDSIRAYVCGNDDRLVVFVQDQIQPPDLALKIATWYKIPESIVIISKLDEVPSLPSGKVDYAALNRTANALQPASDTGLEIQEQLKKALRTNNIDLDCSFVEMGGDSLAYLEMQLNLAAQLGDVPHRWEHIPFRDLVKLSPPPDRGAANQELAWQTVPGDLLARLAAIFGIISLHSTGWSTGGGGYLLLILIGYSIARFQSSGLFAGNVLRTWNSMLTPILVCYYGLLVLITLFWHPVGYPWFLLLGNFETDIPLKGLIPYWFVSAYFQIVIAITLPFFVPGIRQIVQRRPFTAGLVTLACLAVYLQLVIMDDKPIGLRHRHPVGAMELMMLGWCIYFATDVARKTLVSVIIVAVWWFGWDAESSSVALFILLGSAAIIWNINLRLPNWLATLLIQCGTLTLFIYLTHVVVISFVSRVSPFSSDVLNFVLIIGGTLSTAYIMKKGYTHLSEKVLELYDSVRRANT